MDAAVQQLSICPGTRNINLCVGKEREREAEMERLLGAIFDPFSFSLYKHKEIDKNSLFRNVNSHTWLSERR